MFIEGSTVTLTNCTLSGNSAFHGGGVFSYNCSTNPVTLTNSTISGNSASGDGGGIAVCGWSPVYLTNTIVADNVDPGGEAPDVLNFASPVGSGAFVSQDYNLIENVTGATFAAQAHDITGEDPRLGPLADNGGPTLTHALLSGSPAIDAGNTDLSVDQRGESRPFGPADDIGAFEVQSQPPTDVGPDDVTLEGNQPSGTAVRITPSINVDKDPVTQRRQRLDQPPTRPGPSADGPVTDPGQPPPLRDPNPGGRLSVSLQPDSGAPGGVPGGLGSLQPPTTGSVLADSPAYRAAVQQAADLMQSTRFNSSQIAQLVDMALMSPFEYLGEELE